MKHPSELHVRSPFLFRSMAIGFALCMLAAGALGVYVLWTEIVPLYGRLYRNAPVVETPLKSFFVLAGIALTPLMIVACAIAAWTGQKFDPPKTSWLYGFQLRSLQLTLVMMACLAPAMIALTTATLSAKGYWSCPKLRISGSGWQMFWVNDERVCFTPDFYINDHWPCKRVGKKDICIQVDGR
ncbi:hypothetical protein PMI38_00567 [Pseudomonas sp. GM84]|uniref:hypothetical protein n=1 Tax=Pseudomonas sp. GM84 TaxID=1144340 RepID=UPI00026F9332|nr:hypothetical protein [Pseudomonas sp. GM84]EJN39916.1 hypothetical protein PMI38_00567 [Pseudomonas sp. GM84]